MIGNFISGDGLLDATWWLDLSSSKPFLVNTGKLSMSGVQYNEPLKKYLMIQWYYTNGSGHLAPTDSTWLFYESPTPWGPWKEFGSQKVPNDGYYSPAFAPKFISPDGLKLVIFTNGNFMTHAKHGDECRYRLTQIPCTLKV